MVTRAELFENIKSGNFSVYYHDNGCSIIYKGKHDFDNIEWDEVEEEMEKLIMFESEPDGYYTSDLALLVEALGGNLYSV